MFTPGETGGWRWQATPSNSCGILTHWPGAWSTTRGCGPPSSRSPGSTPGPILTCCPPALERATRLAPRFRRRPVPSPAGLSTPQWVDCEFDLSLHLRRIEAPAPYTPATVLEFARTEAMTDFDPSRPLWALTLIEGLEGDRAALVMKVHHSLTDGIGGMQIAMLVFETTPALGPVDEVPLPETAPVPNAIGLARGALGHSVDRVVGAVRTGMADMVPVARAVVRHPLRSVLDALATASSLGRFVAPVSDTLSPIMTARGLDRRLDLFEVDLADLKRAGFGGGQHAERRVRRIGHRWTAPIPRTCTGHRSTGCA